MTDRLNEILADLPQALPERPRAARIRTRCHAALASSRPSRTNRAGGGRRRRWQPLLAALGAVYFVEAVRLTLHFYGIG